LPDINPKWEPADKNLSNQKQAPAAKVKTRRAQFGNKYFKKEPQEVNELAVIY
jgi:hypothetical protein